MDKHIGCSWRAWYQRRQLAGSSQWLAEGYRECRQRNPERRLGGGESGRVCLEHHLASDLATIPLAAVPPSKSHIGSGPGKQGTGHARKAGGAMSITARTCKIGFVPNPQRHR